MSGYAKINLAEISEMMGEEYLLKIISDFSCPYNKDVEKFLHVNAVEFARQSISATHLLFAPYKGEKVLVGYFTLANKHFHIDLKGHGINGTLRRRINRFAHYDSELKKYIVSAPLIGQLGKNYTNGYNKLITGDELLKIACDTVKEVQGIIGGKMVYLECEDTPKLLEFYSENGFYNFGKRLLENDEKDLMQGQYLIQMLKYLK